MTPTLKTYLYKGSVSAGYQYGLVPYVITNNPINSIFQTEGIIGLNLFSLPVNAQYFFSTAKGVNGMNNYFRLSFDAEKYKVNMLNKLEQRKKQLAYAQDSLNQLKDKVTSKLLYQQLFSNFLSGTDSLAYLQLLKDSVKYLSNLDLSNLSTNYSSTNINNYNNSIKDSINTFKSNSTLTDQQNLIEDSIKNLSSNVSNVSNTALANCNNVLQNINSQINQNQIKISEYKSKLDSLKSNLDLTQNPEEWLKSELSKKNSYKAINSINKLDVGLCNPNLSAFLMQNLLLKGINTEIKFKNSKIQFSAGQTVTNLQFSNNLINNNLFKLKNWGNYIDFRDVNGGRKVIASTYEIGSKEKASFKIGFLYGKGRNSYLNLVNLNETNYSSNQERNFVFSLSSNFNLKKYGSLELDFGKSSLQVIGDEAQKNTLLKNLFSIEDRTYAFQTKYQLRLKKINQTWALSGRIVDPFFKSFGVGFIRSNNIRYDIKLEQCIGKKIKLIAQARREQDNILKYFTYTNILQSAGLGIQYKINRHWQFRANYQPMLMNLVDSVSSLQRSTKNLNLNASITYSKQFKNSRIVALTNYSNYQMNSTDVKTSFESYIAQFNYNYLESFEIGDVFNYFIANNLDTLNGNSLLLTKTVKIKLKKLSLSGGVKYFNSALIKNDIGYLLALDYKINKNISYSLQGEKLVAGDYFNTIQFANTNNFPYLISTKLIINW